MQALTVTEYAAKIGAELKPTCLADMPVLEVKHNSDSDNFFVGMERVKTWITVKDPSGGLNKSGTWPFVVTESDNGKLSILAQSY
jgi:hypothetical protein